MTHVPGPPSASTIDQQFDVFNHNTVPCEHNETR